MQHSHGSVGGSIASHASHFHKQARSIFDLIAVDSLSSGRCEINLAAVHSFLRSIPDTDVPLSASGDYGIFIEANPAHCMVFIDDL